MAYDPKTYLQQALKTGFESVYSQPSSLETGEAPQYQGDVATFGNVQVRPLSEPVYEGTGDAAYQIGSTPSGHVVSAPLTGQYQGYFRNDIYDSQGNFVRTAISEPDNDPYGLKGLSQLGLMALSAGALGPTGQLFSKGIGAIGALKSGDPLRILGAVSGIPGAGDYIPAELATAAKYAGQAGNIKAALSGDPSAIFRLVSGADKSGVLSGKAASAGYGGADPGYFDPEAETSPLPSWALDPYASDDVYEDIESLLARYENQGFADTPTGDLSQSIDITGRRETDIPDWDILPDVYTPRSIRDIGTVTQVGQEPLEGTEIKEPDLATGLPKAVVSPPPKPAAPGKAPTPSPAPKAAKPGMDLGALFAFLEGMGDQQPTQAPSSYQTARINAESPFGLMYGLES